MHGAILDEYLALSSTSSVLGFPLTDERVHRMGSAGTTVASPMGDLGNTQDPERRHPSDTQQVVEKLTNRWLRKPLASTFFPICAGRAGRGWERVMKAAYRGFAFAVAIGVVLQAAWIALATYSLGKYVDDGHTVNKDWNGNVGLTLHGIFAIIVLVCAIVLFGLSFRAQVPDGTKWAGYVLLAVVVQWVLAFISFGVPAVGILHGANAFVVVALAGLTGRRAAEAAPTRGHSTVA